MKQNKIAFFWFGFFASAAATAWLYWIWRKSRVVTPAPLIISRSESYQPVVKEVSTGVAEANARDENADVPMDRSDKLDAISGIGPVTVERLNDAGIYTFKQLGSLSPEQLQEISGTVRWDPNDWIDQARDLADL